MKNRFLLPIFSIGLLSLCSASAATLVAGFDWTASNTSNKSGTGIAISSVTASFLSQATSSGQSFDGSTWGSAALDINPDTGAGRIRTSSGGNGVLTFTVTNNSASTIQLDQWHLNTWGSADGVTVTAQLDYVGSAGGASEVPTQWNRDGHSTGETDFRAV